MKTWHIEIQKVRAMATANGQVRAQIDGLVQPAAPARDGAVPATILEFSEDTARVLVLLLKAQLAELDSKKAKSRRG